MPIFNFFCAKCQKQEKKLMAKRPAEIPVCPTCSGERTYTNNMATIVLETFDNGFMTKKVERLRDIEQLKKDRQELFLSTVSSDGDIV